METINISKELEAEIANANSLEEVVQICAQNGIMITKEQLEAEMIPVGEAELSEDMLMNVSGGGIISSWLHRIAAIRYTAGGGGFSSGGGGNGSFGGGRVGGR